MDHTNALLRKIPKMDALLAGEEARRMIAEYSYTLVATALREAVEQVRAAILAGGSPELSAASILGLCRERLEKACMPHQRPVINATGVVLHTNLGRSLLAESAARAAETAATHYTNLEFDCETGSRGDRYSHVEGLIRELLGVESAIVVNNNAAAVLLMLSALARGKEIVVSRGELVEIGGSFRVPEVMEQSGCFLKEVGATNKTHPADYEKAIGENTAALLKVHTSNYRVVGFTQDVPLEGLSEIAHRAGLPLLHDLGSGALLPLSSFGLSDEPIAQDSVKKGADVVCFSGDKLLGGPQAGILAGKKQYLDLMKKHPLMRALRVDKLTLAALEATLALYRDQTLAQREIPLYQMLSQPVETLLCRAERFQALLGTIPGLQTEIIETRGQVGGGSAPGETIPSAALALRAENASAERLYHRLLCAPVPVVTRINADHLIFDMRTVREEELSTIAQTLENALCEEEAHE